MIVNEATGAKINDFDFTAGVGLDQDVLGFEIAVDEIKVMYEI